MSSVRVVSVARVVCAPPAFNSSAAKALKRPPPPNLLLTGEGGRGRVRLSSGVDVGDFGGAGSSPRRYSKMAEASSSNSTPTLGGDREKCVFCRICDGKEDNEIFYQDDDVVVFQDIRPAAKYHLLVVTKDHIRDSKSLVPSQIGVVNQLVETGNRVLGELLAKDNGGKAEDVPKQLGFHWPPFHTVSHLHLHVIAPANEMGFLSRTIFRPNSFWFVTPEYVKDRLEKMATEEK